jgi:hypothetical protein
MNCAKASKSIVIGRRYRTFVFYIKYFSHNYVGYFSQVYVKGKFVGGADILLQMHKDGEITDFLAQNGIKSKFSDE